ncbi:LysR family transcriptional regulator [Phycicoccus avicenniae]|uniref:LysR family transcriptional regulator n=1 Tax=Phycicoccus avicenniae TaxID=2828860 RepID=UPI003D282565
MDLLAACRVLAQLDERGSVTAAAGALGIAQSVASRRLTALEQHLGGALVERTARRAVLTPLGRDLVPTARRLVALAEELELDAERARRRPLTLAVPEACAVRDLAVLDAGGRDAGLRVEPLAAGPVARADLVARQAVRTALLPAPGDEATWTVPLGVGGRVPGEGPVRLERLRTSRRGRGHPDALAGTRLRTAPEDDVPHVRDVLVRAGAAAGLLPGQLPVDGSRTAALAGVLADDDLLLCSALEAQDLGLEWRPLAGVELVRGYRLVGESGDDVRALLAAVAGDLGAALGARRVTGG